MDSARPVPASSVVQLQIASRQNENENLKPPA